MRIRTIVASALAILTMTAGRAQAAPFFFSNGDVDGLMAAASRPDSASGIEIEAGDDFVLTDTTTITGATFTGLLADALVPASVTDIAVEIYRVFPLDSDTTRTATVPTRTNSPSDVAFETRDSSQLTFTTTSLGPFTAANSVLNGINPAPNQTTGGEGAVTGAETLFDVNFSIPLVLAPGHYFFIPQVLLSDGQFYWLSSVRPIVPPGTPFAPDLQAWIRNANLDPDWLRIGTDIIGGSPAPTFNLAFSLTGTTGAAVPEPATTSLFLAGMAGLAARRRRRLAL
jgi:hypothetical protein